MPISQHWMTDMAIYGTYQCDNCNIQFKGWREMDGPYPDCPQCDTKGGWAPQSPNIIGNKAKAVDIAQKVAEETFGLTDMRDNTRQGDVIAKGPAPIQTAEADAITRDLQAYTDAPPELAPHLKSYVQNFFGATNQGPSVDPLATIQSAAPAARAAREQGADPIALLGSSQARNGGISRLNVVARDTGKL